MVEDLLSDDEARTVLKRILAMYPNAKGELHWIILFICYVQ